MTVGAPGRVRLSMRETFSSAAIDLPEVSSQRCWLRGHAGAQVSSQRCWLRGHAGAQVSSQRCWLRGHARARSLVATMPVAWPPAPRLHHAPALRATARRSRPSCPERVCRELSLDTGQDAGSMAPGLHALTVTNHRSHEGRRDRFNFRRAVQRIPRDCEDAHMRQQVHRTRCCGTTHASPNHHDRARLSVPAGVVTAAPSHSERRS